MAYAVRADLVARLGGEEVALRVTDPVSKNATNESLLTGALAGAHAKVDSYLYKRYAVPVATTNTEAIALLRSITLDIAELEVWGVVGINDRVRQRYDDALLWLRDVASGKAGLPSDVGVTAQSN